MDIPLNEAHKLALSISSCPEVCKAAVDKTHPCHKVVDWQAKQWEPEVKNVFDSEMHGLSISTWKSWMHNAQTGLPDRSIGTLD
jgi:hypothetical protein